MNRGISLQHTDLATALSLVDFDLAHERPLRNARQLKAACIDLDIICAGEGKQYLKLLRADYDINTMPLLDESNILELSSFEPGVLAGSINQVIVKYHDIETNKDASVPANNLASVDAQGGRLISQDVEYRGAWNADMAGQLAERDLRAYASLPAKIKLTVRGDIDVRKGDVLAFSWAKLKITRMPIRVVEIDRGTPTDNRITLTASQDVYSMPTQGWVSGQPSLWQKPDLTPLPPVAQRLVEASRRDLAATFRAADLAALTDDSGYVGALASRPAAVVAYGYRLNTRIGTSGAWKTVGGAPFAPSGVLHATMPQEAGPTLVTLDVGIDLDAVVVGGEAVVDNEVCRVDAINAATGAVTLARGCVDSVPAAHLAGARVWFTDTFTGTDPAEYLTGETIQAQMLTITGMGVTDAATAAISSVTLAQRQARPYPPAALKVNGTAYPATATGALTISWAHRDRLTQADQLVDTTQGNIGPEAGVTYTVRTYLGSSLVNTQSGLTGTSATVTVATAGTVRVEVAAVRGVLVSTQTAAVTFVYTP